jgi:hypothetical protein
MIIFTDGFEAANFCNWSYVQAQDEGQGGPGISTNFVAPARSFGVPAHSGENIARFNRPEWAVSLPHAKAYKEWSNIGKRDQFGRVEDRLPNNGDPSGIYTAWYFLPGDYQFTSREWTTPFHFKEEGLMDGEWSQNPNWGLSMSSARAWGVGGTEPVIFASHWNNSWGYTPKMMNVPLGRWFEIRAELHEGDRIDWFVDGRKLDTSLNSKYPVGRTYERSDGWILAIGHYLGIGMLYVDDVRVTSFSEEDPSPHGRRGEPGAMSSTEHSEVTCP